MLILPSTVVERLVFFLSLQDGFVDIVNKQTRQDFQKFVRIHSHRLNQEDLDIVQLALSDPSCPAVLDKGKEAASKRPGTLYIECWQVYL